VGLVRLKKPLPNVSVKRERAAECAKPQNVPTRVASCTKLARPGVGLRHILQRQTRQRCERASNVEQARVGVDVHGEVERRMAHSGLGRPRRDAVLALVSAEGVSQGVEFDGAVGPVRCLTGGFRLALGQDGLEEPQVVGMMLGQVFTQFGPRHDLPDMAGQLQQVGHVPPVEGVVEVVVLLGFGQLLDLVAPLLLALFPGRLRALLQCMSPRLTCLRSGDAPRG